MKKCFYDLNIVIKKMKNQFRIYCQNPENYVKNSGFGLILPRSRNSFKKIGFFLLLFSKQKYNHLCKIPHSVYNLVVFGFYQKNKHLGVFVYSRHLKVYASERQFYSSEILSCVV